MVNVSIDEMQKNFIDYLRLVKTGETLIVTQGNEPLAEIKAISQVKQKTRPFGLCKGEFIVPSDFDAPLPDEVQFRETFPQCVLN